MSYILQSRGSAAYRRAAFAGTVPVNIAPPTITGTAQVAQVLTANPGTWKGNPPTFTYQWRAAGSNIAGATGQTYTVASGDVGKTIQVVVTARNSTGAVSATSAATAAVIA